MTLSVDICHADKHASKDLLLQSIRYVPFSLECFFNIVFFFLAADDLNDHVSTVRLGPAPQRHHCDLLVWNTV